MEQRLRMEGGGTLTVCREENRVRLLAERPMDGRGLYKVWLYGRGGRQLLGTLAPEKGLLQLHRTLSVRELEQSGCWPIAGAEAVLSFSFRENGGWYCEQHPERMVHDPELQRQFHGSMLCRREGGGFHLAAPFRTDGPLALETLFCLGHLEKIQGRPHLVWNFKTDGTPELPKSEDEGTG